MVTQYYPPYQSGDLCCEDIILEIMGRLPHGGASLWPDWELNFKEKSLYMIIVKYRKKERNHFVNILRTTNNTMRATWSH